METRDAKKPGFYQETGFPNPRYSPRYRIDEPQILRLLRSSLRTRNSLPSHTHSAYRYATLIWTIEPTIIIRAIESTIIIPRRI